MRDQYIMVGRSTRIAAFVEALSHLVFSWLSEKGGMPAMVLNRKVVFRGFRCSLSRGMFEQKKLRICAGNIGGPFQRLLFLLLSSWAMVCCCAPVFLLCLYRSNVICFTSTSDHWLYGLCLGAMESNVIFWLSLLCLVRGSRIVIILLNGA